MRVSTAISPYAFPGLVTGTIVYKTPITQPHILCERYTNRICTFMGIDDPQILMTNSRKRELVGPRQIIMTILRSYGVNTVQIGKYFHKDHTSVIEASKRVKRRMSVDIEYRKLYNKVYEHLKN